MKLYVSGPMTGRPDFNRPAFHRVASRLETAGYGVLNPARHSQTPAVDWAVYMRLALVDLAEADGVCTLPGWADSPGAQLEVHIAEQLAMPVRDLLGWLTEARHRGVAP